MQNTSKYSEHTHDPERMSEFNFDHILNGIYIGNNMCCQMGLSERLEEEQITIDISLDDETIDQPFGVEMFNWVPVKDGLTPSIDLLYMLAHNIQQFVTNQKRVYVHCAKGHGRSASVVMAYLLLEGHEFDDAFTVIKTARDDIHLNDTQVATLREFADQYT